MEWSYGRNQPERTTYTYRERHIGDYDFISMISREDAEKDFEVATELVTSIKKFLDDQEYITSN